MLSKNSHAASTLAYPKNLFLLNPNHEGLLGKGKPLSRTFALTTVMFALGVVGLLMSVWFFATGANELFTTARLINAGIAVPGEIVSYPAGTINSLADGYLYPITYRFSPPGSTVSGQVLVHKDVFDRLSREITVTVKYLPGNPAISMLVGVDAERTFEGGAFVSIAIGFAGLIAAVVYLLPPMRRLWRELRLKHAGHVVVGQVLYCRRYAPTMVIRPDSPDYDPDVSNNFYVELSFRFQPPEGKEIRGQTRHKRNDLKGTRLPTFGAPVAVLYLSRKNYKVL